MSIKKTVAIAAAAGALAAISVPAMAFENEFHGSYAFSTIFSNFQNGGAGDFALVNTPQRKKMNNYFEQRARLQYIAKASDDLKLVTHFEIDSRFGNGAATSGGDLDTDALNFETKHVYLDFNLGKNFNTKLGLQPYTDTIKGLFITADIPAIMTTTKVGAYKLNLGFSRFDDDYDGTTVTRLGERNKDLFIMDNIVAFNKDTKAAFSYYFLADYAAGTTGFNASNTLPNSNILETTGAAGNNAILLHTFALSGESKMGPLTLSGFAAMQAGHQKNFVAPGKNRNFHGWAANVAAKAAVGPGTFKAAGLFTSGNNSTKAGSYKGWVTSSVNSYNEGGMMILARNTANSPSTTDRYIRRNVTNIALATVGYDANLTNKVYVNSNLGFAWTPASDKEGTTKNSGDFMGAELNVETGYKVYDNLTLKAQAAYMLQGAVYKDTASNNATKNPENPYTVRLLASYAF